MDHRLVARRIGLGLLACALCCHSLVASAQSEDFRRKEAEQRFKEGLALHEKGKEDEARVKFEQAYVALKRPNILFALARSEELSGHAVEAATHYRDYLLDPQAKDPKLREQAATSLADLNRDIGRLEVSGPKGALYTVDGVNVPEVQVTTGLLIVKPGTHIVEARVGERSDRVQIEVARGQIAKCVLHIDEKSPAVASVSTPPNGNVPATPPRTPVEPSGTEPKPAPQAGPSWTGPVILGGVGVASLAAGIFFAVSQQGKLDDAEGLAKQAGGRPCADAASATCGAYDDVLGSARFRGTAAYVGYGVGGAALVGAGVWALINLRNAPSQPRAGWRSLVPVIGVNYVGLSLGESL